MTTPPHRSFVAGVGFSELASKTKARILSIFEPARIKLRYALLLLLIFWFAISFTYWVYADWGLYMYREGRKVHKADVPPAWQVIESGIIGILAALLVIVFIFLAKSAWRRTIGK